MTQRTLISSSSVRSYADTYNTFSGCDMTVVMNIPIIQNGEHKTLRYVVGELQTLTYSTNMNRQAVRSISNVNAKDYVMGQRTIAGSMVFSVFDKHFSKRIINDLNKLYNTGSDILVDELPPMNINIVMANEYGSNSDIVIYGVRFVNEGQVMSVNDIYMENTYQYVATGLRYAKADRNPNKIAKKNKITPQVPPLLEAGKGNVAGVGENISLKNPWEDILIYDPGEIISDKPIYDELDKGSNIKDPGNVPEDKEDLPPDEELTSSYQFVSLLVNKGRIINGRQEVLLYVIPERTSGYIYIESPNLEKRIKRPYYGNSVLVALEPGEYYCRYIDKNASSTIEYVNISIDNLAAEKDKENDQGGSDQGVIDDITKDTVKVTNSKVYLKDLNGLKYYPDKDLIISGLIPDTPYKLYIKDKEINIKTEKTNLDLYDKLKERSEGYFYTKDKEMEEILERIRNLTIRNNDMVYSSYLAYQEFTALNDLKYKEIMDILMFYSISLDQRKKQLENKDFDIPTIENYSTNKIYINNSAEKLVIQKLPKDKYPPKIINKEEFEIKHNKYFYQIKDPYNNLYEVYSLDAFNVKSPSIMLFSNIEEEKIKHAHNYYEIDSSIDLEKLKEVQVRKRIKLKPIEHKLEDQNIILDLIDYVDIENAKVVLVNIENINNRMYYSYKELSGRYVYYDLYDLGEGNNRSYAFWIQDKYGRIISQPSIVSLNDNLNKTYVKNEKTSFYKKIILSDEYKILSPISKSIVDRTLEQSEYTEHNINLNYLKEMFENKVKNTTFSDDILFFKKIFYKEMTGVKKVNIKELINTIEKDKIIIKDGYLAKLTIICPITLSIKTIEAKNIIDLNSFNNKYVIIEVYNKTKDIFASPIIRYMPYYGEWYNE